MTVPSKSTGVNVPWGRTLKKRAYKKPDHFSRMARKQGYEARSVFKLEEVQRRCRLLKRGDFVVDLGCKPGSWSRFALETIGKSGRLVGIDLESISMPPGVFLEASVFEVTHEVFREHLGGPANVVLCDMAPSTSGHALHDHVMQIELARRAFELACDLLVDGGNFVTKVFDGEDAPGFFKEVAVCFEKTRRIRPKAVRKTSKEWFLVGLGYRGGKA